MRIRIHARYRLLLILIGLTLLFCLPVRAAYDDTDGHWAQSSIDRWSEYHIVEGYEGRFDPENSMTRAELAKVLSNMLGLSNQDAELFLDVPEDAWYAPYVLRCRHAGILQGDDLGQVHPADAVTRQEAMVMICRALALPMSEWDCANYTDWDQVADWAKPSVQTLIATGAVNGVSDTELAPESDVSRASIMAILDRLISVYIPEPDACTLLGEDGLVLVSSADVTLTGDTAGSVLITPGASGGSVVFDRASVAGAITLQADGCRITEMESALPGVLLSGVNGTVRCPEFYLSSMEEDAGSSVVLNAGAFVPDTEFQWYLCADFSGADPQPISGATQDRLDTGAFQTPEVRYYRCALTAPGESEPSWSQVYAAAYTGLPAVSIHTDSGAAITSKEEYVDAVLGISSAGEWEAVPEQSISIKGRGNSTWGMPKKGYTFKFESKIDLFGLGKDKKWALVANYADKSLLRNWYAAYLSHNVISGSGWQPSYVPVDLMLNGTYQGCYVLADPIKISGSRVDIPDILEVYQETGSTDGGGFILEVETRADTICYFTTDRGVVVTMKDPDMEDATEEELAALEEYCREYVQSVEDMLYSGQFTDPVGGYSAYLDVDSFVDWFLINELTKNCDAAFDASVYLYFDPADGLLHMGPNWDFDISCGNINYRNCDNPVGFHVKNALWISRLFQDPAFAQRVRERWDAVTPLLMESGQVIQAQADLISVAAQLNFNRWDILGTYVWPNADGYENRTTYQSEIDYLKDWLNARIAWLDSAL